MKRIEGAEQKFMFWQTSLASWAGIPCVYRGVEYKRLSLHINKRRVAAFALSTSSMGGFVRKGYTQRFWEVPIKQLPEPKLRKCTSSWELSFGSYVMTVMT